VDWKKEYRVSDLFRREKAGKEPEPGPAPRVPAKPESSAPEPSIWKKEISVSDLLRRGKKTEEGPAPAAGPPPEPASEQTAPEHGAPGEALPESSKASPAAQEPAQAEEPPSEQPPAEAVGAEAEPAGDAPAAPEAAIASASAEPAAQPEPAAPPEPESPREAEPSIWKREIRVSDFLRRGKKERAGDPVLRGSEQAAGAALAGVAAAGAAPEPPVAGDPSELEDGKDGPPAAGEAVEVPAKPSGEDGASAAALGAAAGVGASSIWKKEIKLSGLFSRKPGTAAETTERTEPRPAQLRTETGGASRGPTRTNGAGPLPDVPLVRALNLLPREEVKVRTARPVLPYAGVGLLAVLVVGALAFVFLNERSKIADQKAAKEDLEAQIAALQAVEQTSPQEGVQIAGEALTRASALSTALDGRIVWDRLLRDLSLTLPDGVWFSAVTSAPAAVTPDALPTPPGLTIGGYAKSQSGVAQLVSRLGVLPELSSLQLQSSTVVLLGEEEVLQFTIVATLAQTPVSAGTTTAAVSPTEVSAS
jgi:Tfp pilus assembly protein PilN